MDEYCDDCGGRCDGVHSLRKETREEQIQHLLNLLLSQDKQMLDEVLQRLIKIRSKQRP